MSTAGTAPYGAWKSPITADLIVGGSVGLGQVALDGEDIYWTESRPSEDGRTIVVKRAAGGAISDVTPAGFSVRGKVHEYGGGSFAVAGGTVWFCNETDQRVWAQSPGAAPRPLSETGARRYADFSVDSGRSRLLAVCEDHSGAGEAENFLIAVEFAGGTTALHRGRDFYAFPRMSPDRRKLAWICWDHPNMPWDGTELWLADIAADGGLANEKCVAGGPDEAIFQPQWSPGGVLHFVSDRTGWWNLYRLAGEPEPLCAMEAEFGLPVWQFGLSTYGFTGDGEIVAAHAVGGVWRLGLVARDGGALRPLDLPFADVAGIRAGGGHAAFTAAGSDDASAIVLLDTKSGAYEIVRRSAGFDIDPRYVSEPEPVSFPTAEGVAHGFLYGPANADFSAPKGSLPPLIVKGHGGPTGQTTGAFSLKIQYWTSRGFAVLDVNYRGSTGFGRDYRRKLDGAWGIADVEDCIAGARWAVAAGRADGARLAISGGSAGGYTVLAALAFHDVFAAGASHYGIGDLAALDDDTHKFESRYTGRLLGESPSAEQVRYDRSPINHAGGLNCPVIFFQGLDDKVVLPNQAEAMVAALREKGIPVAYVPFAGEGHGFRRAANVKRALEGELYFYGRVFGFDPADEIEPVEIENL